MELDHGLVSIPCPLCLGREYSPWAHENGFACVRCTGCGLLYVNPRPSPERVDRAVQLGCHGEEANSLNVVGSRVPERVSRDQGVIREMFPDLLARGTPISWLDVGAGFGEFVEAVQGVAPPGSTCEGLEPMLPKARDAQARGLSIRAGFLSDITRVYDVVSLIDVFSHIPDFRQFLKEIKNVLGVGGEILIKTGNNAEIGDRKNFPDPLTLPDHLVFAGEAHVARFLEEAGFAIVGVRRYRFDGIEYSLKNLAKWLLRRPVVLRLPYTSPARAIYIRARLVAPATG